jgi:hypothetical protein
MRIGLVNTKIEGNSLWLMVNGGPLQRSAIFVEKAAVVINIPLPMEMIDFQ